MKSAGKVFILGDSYSTFEGCIPEGYLSWYQSEYEEKYKDCTDVTSASETWWYMFMQNTNSELVYNSSYSGSTVCNTGYGGADFSKISFITRIDELINDGFFEKNSIDTFFVFGATNDAWAGVPMGELKYTAPTKGELFSFLPALSYMLCRITQNVRARIIYIVNTGLREDIVDGIVSACAYYGVETLFLHDISKTDGHPNIEGMKNINDQIIEYLEGNVKNG